MRRALPILTVLIPSALGLAQSATPAPSREPIAIVSGKPIYDEDVTSLLKLQIYQLRQQEYEQKNRILEALVSKSLVEAEALKRGISAEKLLEGEADSKVAEPTDGEVQAYYLAQKDRLNKSLTEVKPLLVQLLRQARLQEARQNYFSRLREKSDVRIFLRQPKLDLGFDPARVRGNPDAGITIVEFSDFQCPFCQRSQGTLKETLRKYEGRVKLAYRDFPLPQIHPQAEIAAEASRCAGEQGKFWEYHDVLYANQRKLDRDSLVEHARTLKLDSGRFDACLAEGRYKAAVEQDLIEGRALGVNVTPSFFVNGVLLSGDKPAAEFEKIIDAELARARQ